MEQDKNNQQVNDPFNHLYSIDEKTGERILDNRNVKNVEDYHEIIKRVTHGEKELKEINLFKNENNKTSNKKTLNTEQLIKHYKWFNHQHESEIRIIHKTNQKDAKSFFIHNENELREVCEKYFLDYNIYIGVNEREAGGTRIEHVKFITNLIIDVDVDSIKNTEDAIRVGKRIASDFIKKECHTPLTTCSGRGMQLFFAINPIENTEDSRIKLKMWGQQLKSQYDTEIVKIDAAVFEPARIMRLAGTWNNKPTVGKQVYIINEDGVERFVDEKLTNDFLSVENIPTTIKQNTCGVDILSFLEKDKKMKDLFEGNIVLEKYPNEYPKDKRIDTTELAKFPGRSEAEQSLVCKLIYNGADKATVYAIMEQSKIGRWNTKDNKYKEITYNAAAKLVTQSKIEMPKEVSPHKFNLIEDERIENWIGVKNQVKKYYRENGQMCFFMHNKDKLMGKAMQFYNTKQKIRICEKTEQEKDDNVIERVRFLDEGYDRRSEVPVEKLYLDLWVYKLTVRGKEYIILSENELNEEETLLEGMIVDLQDEAEISKKLKLQKLTPTMFVWKSFPTVQILSKDDLVNFCKEEKWDEEKFFKVLFLHPNNKVYHHSKTFEKLMGVFMLSGKYEGYPLHLLLMGPAGGGKTTLQEAINYKFEESNGIFEAGNSTIKGLIPSFRENPPAPGYILKCSRLALVDELMKCLDNARASFKDLFQVQFGQLNMLLEHKKRMIGSGMGSNLMVHATAKVLFTTNPLADKTTIAQHATELDISTLSRVLIWCQDKEHLDRVFSRKSEKFGNFRAQDFGAPNLAQNDKTTHEQGGNLGVLPSNTANPKNNIKPIYNYRIWENYINIDNDSLYVFIFPFRTIYDSCQSFLCNIDEDKINKIARELLFLAKDPMRTVLRARIDHHFTLMVDGITKFRCLFKDYDSSFAVKEEDYVEAKKLMVEVIKSWDTNYSVLNEENTIQ